MLPITPHLKTIHHSLMNHQMVIVHSTPGSGKTTLVPHSLLEVCKGKILVIEPRKIATRWAARFVAGLVTDPKLVGYIYRFENKTSPETRIIYLTEGTFLRYIQTNSLNEDDVVILDEFHERHLSTDLSFGWLVERTKKKSAPKIILMSATIDDQFLKTLPLRVECIKVTTPVFPLKLIYAPKELDWSKRELEQKVMWGIQLAFEYPGDMLVFLPGISEIQRVKKLLEKRLNLDNFILLILHSQFSSSDDEINQKQGKRKIILSTNIAESSLTIDGVRVVVDAGLDRQSVYLDHIQKEELQTIECSQNSCIQRAGRAARQNSGVAIRLFTEENYLSRSQSIAPEVLRSELSETLLTFYSLQLHPETFYWIDRPQETHIRKCVSSLESMDLLKNHQLTDLGYKIQDCPLPLRLARTWLEALMTCNQKTFQEISLILAQAMEPFQYNQLSKRLTHNFKALGMSEDTEKVFLTHLKLNLARGRSHDFIMATGQSLRLGEDIQRKLSVKDKYFIIIDSPPRVHSIYPIENEKSLLPFCELREEQFDENFKHFKRTNWMMGSLVIKSEVEEVSSFGALQGLELLKSWLSEWRESEEATRFSLFQKNLFPEKSLDSFEWDLFIEEFSLDRLVDQDTKLEMIHSLREELQLYFDASFQLKLSDLCPEFFDLHPKKKVKIHYHKDKNPMIESYIQDFFGLSRHPSLLNGQIPLVLGLWGPHGRTQQITSDLIGFWRNHYPSLMRELKIDYPRHFWPEDPQRAEPILRKPRPPR